MQKQEATSREPRAEVGRDAAVLSAVEIGLGSVLHAFKIPFSGHFLSLNQSFLLSRATLKNRHAISARILPAQISSIAALLKSLSPAGKKLTPMLAISAQGLLFSLGTVIGGANLLGILLGAIVSSLWAFIQPVMIYYLIYGKTIIHVADYFYEKTREAVSFEKNQLITVLIVVVSAKLVLSVLTALTANFISDESVKNYERTLLKAGAARRARQLGVVDERQSLRQKAWLAATDLFNPLFVVSLALTAFFFVAAEAKTATLIWGLMRPIAAGFLIFFVVRALPLERLPVIRRAIEALKQI